MKSSISFVATSPAKQRSTKLGRLDIDCPSAYGRFYPGARDRIERAKMFSPGIENLDLSVQRVPGIEPFAAVAPPTPLARECAEMLEIVQNRRVRYRFRHATTSIIVAIARERRTADADPRPRFPLAELHRGRLR